MIDTTQRTVAHAQCAIVCFHRSPPILSFFVSTFQCVFSVFLSIFIEWSFPLNAHFFHTLPLCACVSSVCVNSNVNNAKFNLFNYTMRVSQALQLDGNSLLWTCIRTYTFFRRVKNRVQKIRTKTHTHWACRFNAIHLSYTFFMVLHSRFLFALFVRCECIAKTHTQCIHTCKLLVFSRKYSVCKKFQRIPYKPNYAYTRCTE